MSFIDGVIGDIGDPFAAFSGIGDFFKTIIELTVFLLKNIGPLFEFIFFVINQVIDLIYGSITLLNGIGKELVELTPHISKILDLILAAVDFLINFYKENSSLLVVAVMLIPAYGMLYLLIRQLNAIF